MMYNSSGLLFMLIPMIIIVAPVAVIGIVFWYKAHKMQLELQHSLKFREFEYQQRLKELELEIEKARARNQDKVV